MPEVSRAYYYITQGGNLWAQALDGSPRRKLTHFNDNRVISAFAWSRDGERLAVMLATVSNDIVLFKGLRSWYVAGATLD
jgi:Tol biopolymer transport system component